LLYALDASNLERNLFLFSQITETDRPIVVALTMTDLLYRQSLVSESRALYAQGIALAHDLGDRERECGGITGLGALEGIAGRFVESKQLLQRALVLARETGNARAESGALCMLGGTLGALGQLDEAITCLQQALALANDVGHRRLQSDALGNLGFTLFLRGGRMQEAEAACLASLQIVREVGQVQKQGTALHNLALVREALWRPEEARADFEAAMAIYRVTDSALPLGECLGHLGLLHARQGRHAEALSCLDEGEAQLRAVSDRWLLGILMCGRAEALHWAGNAAASAAALGMAADLAAETGAADESELGAALLRTRALLGTG
jgi:tetratricopeptide (TPR) repeat protein